MRDWWTAKYATIPDVQTSKLHVIGGAITPLWQSLKTTEATHLRVVRVTTDDGQRIVGVQIPSDHVGEVLGALGVATTSREPDEIFDGVLFEDGEEIELTAGLTLKRGNIHGEPAIELCGAHPTMFAVLRKLGLINEQINWKQRFFVPTEEEQGIAILVALLEQFPVIATEDEEAASDVAPDLAMPSASTVQPIDFETWIVETAELHRVNGEEQQPIGRTESEREPTSDESEPTGTHPSQSACLPIAHHGSVPAMLQTLPPDYRTPAIQIGFNFAESES